MRRTELTIRQSGFMHLVDWTLGLRGQMMFRLDL